MSRIYRMRNVVYCCSGGLLCLNLFPHALPTYPSKTRSLSWVGHDPPQELVDHVRKIGRVMGLLHSDKIHVFFTNGLTSMAFGSSWLPKGAAIGLPRTVLFRDPEDVKTSFLDSTVFHMDWDSEVGSSLADSLTPTPQQINFIIAHEMAHLKNSDWLPRVFLPSVMLAVAYHAARSIPQYTAPHRPLAGFVLVMAVSLAIYMQLVASLSQRQELRADRMAAQCSGSYAQGALDHFAKRMKLDSILRSMTKVSTLDRFEPYFSHHPPSDVRFQKIQTLIGNIKF